MSLGLRIILEFDNNLIRNLADTIRNSDNSQLVI